MTSNTRNLVSAFVLASSVSFAACGTQVGQTGNTASNISAPPSTSQPSPITPTFSIAADTPLDVPACGTLNQRQLVFIRSTGQFESCESSGWEPIQLSQSATQSAKNSLTRVVTEAPGSNCANGGQSVQAGVDTDANGQLSPLEVTNVSFVCNGANGENGTNGRDGINGAAGLQVASTWSYHADTFIGTSNISVDGGPNGNNSLWNASYIGDIRLTKFSDGSGFISVSGMHYDWNYSTSNTSVVVPFWMSFTNESFLPASPTVQTLVFKLNLAASSRIRYIVNLGTTPTVKITHDADGDFSNNPTDSLFNLIRQN